jgi:hypothetical protein
VVHRKVTGGFPSEAGATAYAIHRLVIRRMCCYNTIAPNGPSVHVRGFWMHVERSIEVKAPRQFVW